MDEHRQIAVDAPAEAIFRAFTGLGGTRGWLYMNWAWRIRGALDRLCGGVGLRRGRRDADSVRVGEGLDFWRVEAVESGHLMRLRAEMKVPGKAWLHFQVKAQDHDIRPLLTQTAFFAPKGSGSFTGMRFTQSTASIPLRSNSPALVTSGPILASKKKGCLQGENGFSAAGTAKNEGGSISRQATAKDCIKSRNTSWHLLQTRNILIFRERSHNSFR
jgi:Protein of unknown function (DUF2867)